MRIRDTAKWLWEREREREREREKVHTLPRRALCRSPRMCRSDTHSRRGRSTPRSPRLGRWGEVRWGEVRWGDMIWYDMIWWNKMGCDERRGGMKGEERREGKIWWNRNESGWGDRICYAMGWDGMKWWDMFWEMLWDVMMEWDGMKWNGIEE